MTAKTGFRYVFLLSKENLELATEEVKALLPEHRFRRRHNLLLLSARKPLSPSMLRTLAHRLALTRSVHRLIFSCAKERLQEKAGKTDWQSLYHKSFAVRVHDLNEHKRRSRVTQERLLAKIIWHRLKDPKVRLVVPGTAFCFLLLGDQVFATQRLWENTGDFEARKAHRRPFPHPSSLNPKIARAIINLTGVTGKGKILDPMCGAGGFLLEAGLMGLRAEGSDIASHMVRGCERNLIHFGIHGIPVRQQDIFTLRRKTPYVITDLPYGLNSAVQSETGRIALKAHKQGRTKEKIKTLEDFYLLALRKIASMTGRKAVIVMPDFVNYDQLLRKAGLKKEKGFSLYVHRSLQRKILVVSPG